MLLNFKIGVNQLVDQPVLTCEAAQVHTYSDFRSLDLETP